VFNNGRKVLARSVKIVLGLGSLLYSVQDCALSGLTTKFSNVNIARHAGCSSVGLTGHESRELGPTSLLSRFTDSVQTPALRHDYSTPNSTLTFRKTSPQNTPEPGARN
jgi:hypothetical protein